MEAITKIIDFTFFLTILLIPIPTAIKILYSPKIEHKFWIFLLISLVFSTLLMLSWAWWGDFSTELLLKHYGYPIDIEEVMQSSDRYENVAPENIERVDQLKISYYGIGWPLKAMLSIPFHAFYSLIVFIISWFIHSMTRQNHKK